MSTLTDENLDEFTITFRREIVFYLRQLINEGVQISVVFNEGHDTLLTMLLEVNEENGTLIFDWGGSEELNRRFLKSERNYFVARPQGVRNQFFTGAAKEVTYNKRRAFAVKLPEKYVRLQRREFFRLALPMTQRPRCTLRAEDGREMQAETVDIGLGGIGLEVPSLTIPCELGQTFTDATIDLKNFAVLKVALKICFVGQVSRGNKQLIRLGCNFGKISAAQEHELQRFITHVQREERARLG
jgi:c-di-GMP-binding flagellar brake protein YcgR